MINNNLTEKENLVNLLGGSGVSVSGSTENLTEKSDTQFVNADFEGGMSVPTALFTKEGRAGIKDAYKNVRANTKTAMTGAYKMTPMGVSRMVDEKNGDAPAPNLLPGLFSKSEPSETGKDFGPGLDGKYYEIMEGGRLSDTPINPMFFSKLGKFISPYDNNPVFQFLWHTIPGFMSFTKYHDYSIETGKILPQNKATSIPGYLGESLYGSIGTPINMTVDKMKQLFNKQDDQNIDSD